MCQFRSGQCSLILLNRSFCANIPFINQYCSRHQRKMIAVIFSFLIFFAKCDISTKERIKTVKNVLNNYKMALKHNRHFENQKVSYYVKNTLQLLNKTQRFGDLLKYYDVEDCSNNSNNSTYVKRHVYDQLIVDPDLPVEHWKEYKSVFKKNYRTRRHEDIALSVWKENLRLVAEHNKQYLQGRQSYALHLNIFADWDVTKYISKLLKLVETPQLYDPAEDRLKIAYRRSLRYRIPERWDWREKGYRPRREEQWRCGACYAFAVTHVVQAQLFKKHGYKFDLSPQQIVDCSVSDGNFGCDGGSLRAALRYVARKGLERELDYPYIGLKGFCLYNSFRVRARLSNWAILPKDEYALQRALATMGPLAVGINASPRSFQLYKHGIYDDRSCTPFKLNHAMLLVGYTPQYWILLNWWGPHWGEQGYMRVIPVPILISEHPGSPILTPGSRTGYRAG